MDQIVAFIADEVPVNGVQLFLCVYGFQKIVDDL